MAVVYGDQKLKLLGCFVDEEVQAFDVAVNFVSAFLSIGSGAFSYEWLSPASEHFCCTVDSVYILSLYANAEDLLRFLHTHVHRL